MTNLSRDCQRALVVGLVDEMHEAGSWLSETHIQKCVFFLKQVAAVHIEYEFILYKHGPYSFDLREDIFAMRTAQALDLEGRPPYGPSFSVGKFGATLMARFSTALDQHRTQLQFVAENLSDKHAAELERLATAAYVTSEHPDESADDRAEEVHRLKPFILTDIALLAVQETDALQIKAQSLSS